jgi:hypothetical protein
MTDNFEFSAKTDDDIWIAIGGSVIKEPIPFSVGIF